MIIILINRSYMVNFVIVNIIWILSEFKLLYNSMVKLPLCIHLTNSIQFNNMETNQKIFLFFRVQISYKGIFLFINMYIDNT